MLMSYGSSSKEEIESEGAKEERPECTLCLEIVGIQMISSLVVPSDFALYQTLKYYYRIVISNIYI